jgi:hypothetical protein
MTDFGKRSYEKYYDRGDPSDWDFEEPAFTTDGNWHDLDLSSIIPSGNILVHFFASLRDDQVNSLMWYREKGNTNQMNVALSRTLVANYSIDFTFFLLSDSSRKIEYKASNLTFTINLLHVRGWFL